MEAVREVLFLRKLQRLLDEGEFVATYKFALLQALADLSVEEQSSGEGPLPLSINRIAEKFIEYFWGQVVPFRATGPDEPGVLMHNTGRQAAIVNRVIEARAEHGGNLALARKSGSSWRHLVREVAKTVANMPLWKLQVVAGEPDEFLYRKEDFADGQITLLPGVASHFRAFHGLVTRLVRAGWIGQIRAIGANHAVLGEASDLEAFLFGSERQSLEPYRPILREFQEATCFYCRREVRGPGEIDHFVPWSRYPVDLGHNFVLAHSECNARKSDFLAHPDHLACWAGRNREGGGQLAAAFDDVSLPHDLSRSLLIARWAYEQGEHSGAHVWLRGREYLPLGSAWRCKLS